MSPKKSPPAARSVTTPTDGPPQKGTTSRPKPKKRSTPNGAAARGESSPVGPKLDPTTNTTADQPEHSSRPESTVDASPMALPARSESCPPTDPKLGTTTKGQPAQLEDTLILFCADSLDDFESARIRMGNRLGTLTRPIDEYGKGWDGTAEAERMAGHLADLAKIEKAITLDLQKAVRKHPLGPWVKATSGVGEKTAGRLLARIGDPYWHPIFDRPRKLSELNAFCGLHVLHPGQGHHDAQELHAGVDPSAVSQRCSVTQVATADGGFRDPGHAPTDTQGSPAGVAPSRKRGQKANWSTQSKTALFLIAEACVKNRKSAYRHVYDAGREQYADSLHQVECKQCGTKGKPAAVLTPLRPGHQHARAMRLVMKAVLKDLWTEARRLHEGDTE